MENKLSKTVIDYYKNVEDFDLNADDYKAVEDPTKVMNLAVGDILSKKKKRTEKDFNNPSEYKMYLSALYEQASRAERGIPISTYTEDDE